MSQKMMGLLVAGVLPAFLYGTSALFQKYSANTGIGLAVYLIAVGVGVGLAGIVFLIFASGMQVPLTGSTFKGFAYANLFGLLWGLATGFVAFGLIYYRVPISQLVPLYNMNTLVAVILALIVFSEWKDINAVKLLSGSLLVVLGGVVVASA